MYSSESACVHRCERPTQVVSRRNVRDKRYFRSAEARMRYFFSFPLSISPLSFPFSLYQRWGFIRCTLKRKTRLTAFNLKCGTFKEHYATVALLCQTSEGISMKLLRALFRIDACKERGAFDGSSLRDDALLRISSAYTWKIGILMTWQ